MMTISVFGLGYVGCVSAACFAKEGHSVVGVDVNPAKVEMINAGRSTIVEEGITELVADVVTSGRLRATTDVREAVHASTISIIAVGTPSRPNGSIDLRYIQRVAEQIGKALRDTTHCHLIAIRSTVMPGTIDGTVIPAITRASGKAHGEGFVVCSNPEFLREGTSIRDFYDPPFTLIGAHAEEQAAPLCALYDQMQAPIHVTEVRVAEMVKYASNCFHGLKVGFANEIGNLCKALQVDSHEVMRIFCDDRKLNISPAYLRPGFAFGGSCLPKDLRAVVHRGRMEDVELPILEALIESNRRQIDRAFRMVIAAGSRKVAVLGLAFKPGTDDLRESPMVRLIEMLIGKGSHVTIFDRHVTAAGLLGANREYIEREIPHIWTLMSPSIEDAVRNADIVVIGNDSPEFRSMNGLLNGRTVIDLARAIRSPHPEQKYTGIAW